MEPFLELSLEARSIADFTGRIHWINDAYQEALGYTIAEINAIPWTKLAHPGDLPAVMREVAKMAVGRMGRVDVRLRCKDGRFKWFRISAKVAPGEGQFLNRLFYTSAVEITDERELRAAKDRFIATAAHELRTPIAAVNGSIATLTRYDAELSEEERAELHALLQRQGQRLKLLADNLLDHARSELDDVHVDVRPLDLATVVTAVLDHVPVPAGRKVTIEERDAVVEVLADPSRVDQILVNLLANAFAYGGEEVTVRFDSSDRAVSVEVIDDGPGVPAELQPVLFEPFTRGDERVRGSGLGLAVSRRLAESMEGSLVHVPHAEGAAFRLSLPRLEPVTG